MMPMIPLATIINAEINNMKSIATSSLLNTCGLCELFQHLQSFACCAALGLCSVNQLRKVIVAKRCVRVVVVNLQAKLVGFFFTVNNNGFFPSVQVNQIVVLATA